MADITIEQAIALRDTISPPMFIINNLLHNEGMVIYIDMACGRILELLDEHPEYQEYIYLDIRKFDIRVTLFGFWIIKNILLSYITEERYQEYFYALRVKNEQVQAWNGMINLLKGFSNKQLHSLKKEIKHTLVGQEEERILNYVLCELKARRLLSIIKNWYHKQKELLSIHIRGYKVSRTLKRIPFQL